MRSFCTRLLFAGVIGVCSLFACEKNQKHQNQNELVEIASSDRQWTGVAVSTEGRIFVNFPRWSSSVTFSVAEIDPSGQLTPYPNEAWNRWDSTASPPDHLICVQSVYVDRDNYLWILDPAFDTMRGGNVKGGSKLLKIDLNTNEVIEKIYFDRSMAPQSSYLNDVRVDTGKKYAYITDSGLGAIVVLNLSSGQCKRVLGNHPSTKSENIILTIEEKEWLSPDGTVPQIHADGLALDKNGGYLFYQALTSHSLYRIRTSYLHDQSMTESQLEEKVEFVGKTGAADGIAFGPDGHLYLTSLEHNAVKRLTATGEVEIVVADTELKWPDSLAIAADGAIYVSTSQIHLWDQVTSPYKIFKIRPSS